MQQKYLLFPALIPSAHCQLSMYGQSSPAVPSPALEDLDSNSNSLANGLDGLSGDELNLKMLSMSVPGVPGEDYPILAEVPQTGFTCQGKVFGGETET